MKLTFGRKTFLSVLLIGIVAGGVSFLFLGLVDAVIHGDLYNYGLQFSYDWANKYWTYMRIAVICIITLLTVNGLAVFYFYPRRRHRYPIETRTQLKLEFGLTQILSFTLLGTGLAAFTASILYASSPLALIGLGLTFWGALLLYIRTEKHPKEALISKTAPPALATLNQLITELNFNGHAVYLPPKYLKDFESSKIFIPKQPETKLPAPEQMRAEAKMFVTDPEGILLTPPGAELTKHFENTLEISFTRIDLQHLASHLPRLFVEDLEIAANLEIGVSKHKVDVKIENSTYETVHTEAEKLPKVCGSIGCPICSALAGAIAKAAGKPVIIEREQTTEVDRTISVEYRLL